MVTLKGTVRQVDQDAVILRSLGRGHAVGPSHPALLARERSLLIHQLEATHRVANLQTEPGPGSRTVILVVTCLQPGPVSRHIAPIGGVGYDRQPGGLHFGVDRSAPWGYLSGAKVVISAAYWLAIAPSDVNRAGLYFLRRLKSPGKMSALLNTGTLNGFAQRSSSGSMPMMSGISTC